MLVLIHGKICHKKNSDFLDALNSCLSSGLSIWLDGNPLTAEALADSLLVREGDAWMGTCLVNGEGELQGLSFTQNRLGDTL